MSTNRMNVAVLNLSTNFSDADTFAAVKACQKQLSRDVGPLWGQYTARVVFFPGKNPKVPKGYFPMVLMDNADVQGALGYHDKDPNGNPYGRIFTSLALQYHYSVSSILSHELIELRLDVDCNLYGIDFNSGILYAVEGCDAVESDSYYIDGVEVSNFILPHWFDSNHPAGSKFDYLGKLTQPFSMTKGGYLIYMQGGKEQQKTADLPEGTQIGESAFGNIYMAVGPEVPEWKRQYKWNEAARTVRKLKALESLVRTA